jgi:hypothetical protein
MLYFYRRSSLSSIAAALVPLGYELLMESGRARGFGLEGKPYFWIPEGEPGSGIHLAFVARDRQRVDTFLRGGTGRWRNDNGPPGVREHYHPTCYAAFIPRP